ncbi:MAG: RagB/SusD family nutrient uptake outer membrane protein [Tannerellaceae bacterium]
MHTIFKHTASVFLAGFLITGISSCSDYLDSEYIFKDKLNIDSVFMKKDYSERWLAGVYSQLQTGENVIVASKGHQPFNFLSDDMFFGDRDNSYEWFKNCRYSENDKQASWNSCYKGIRDASIFIHNIDKNREFTPEEIKDNKAQARFLRAYFYWLLLRKYGPVPVLPDEGVDYTQEYEKLQLPRNTYEECAEFIASEMAIAAQDLPLARSSREVARASRGAALAVRARAYLYNASPLFNGNTDTWASELTNHEGVRLISATYDEAKWAKAAAAAKEVIDLGIYKIYTAPFRESSTSISSPKTIVPPHHPQYSDKNFPEGWKDIDPFESYRQLFNGDLTASANPELIFTRGVNQNGEDVRAMVLHQVPRSLNGWNTHGVTLKHVDTYQMNDGSDFPTYNKPDPRVDRPRGYTENDEDHLPLPAGVSLEYANREPRFYASIAYNGSVWESESAPIESGLRYKQVFYYRGSQDGRLSSAPGFYIRTGLGIKKFYHPKDYFPNTGEFLGMPKTDPDIRYAEILLIYSEALNELTGSHSFTSYDGKQTISVSRNTDEISNAIMQIRMRGGIPNYTKEVYNNADMLRKAIKRERQIELFAETHRYYDLRRWKDAAHEETMQVWGCNMNMTEQQKDLFHTPIIVPSLPTLFVDKMYLWPISHDELRKNKKLTQNPGWTYYD